jgi:PPOX class probable F420-dependent enzyme
MDVRTMGPGIATFLEAPRCGVIATHDADGAIWQAVVWYAITDDGILMNSLEGRRWPANLRRNPRLSLVVAEGEDYVIMRGEAVVIDDPDRGLVEAQALARRYGVDPGIHTGQRRVSVLFHPQHLAVHGELRLDPQAT